MIGYALAGVAKGLGTGIVEEARAKREAALKELERQQQLEDVGSARAFATSERIAGQEFQSAEQTRKDQMAMEAARAKADAETSRPLTPEERAKWGIPEDDKRPYSITGSEPPKPVGGNSGTTINVGDGMKLTEGQSKDVGFFTRGLYANEDLNALDEKLTNLGDNVASRFGTVGNYQKSDEYRQAERASRDFLAVILRKDTGAAVTPQEFEMYGQIFLPAPGDDPKTLADKRSARERAIKGIELGLGTARPLAEQARKEFEADRSTTTMAPVAPAASPTRPRATNPATGETIEFDGKEWVPVQ